MGMFDTINIKFRLPDRFESNDFQTKDLGCDLNNYEINSSDLKLIPSKPNLNLMFYNKHFLQDGCFEVEMHDYVLDYEYGKEKYNEYSYILYFNKGVLKYIKLNSTGINYTEEYDDEGEVIYDYTYDNLYKCVPHSTKNNEVEYILMDRVKMKIDGEYNLYQLDL